MSSGKSQLNLLFKPVKRVKTDELGSFIITDPKPVLGKGSYGGAVKAKIDA